MSLALTAAALAALHAARPAQPRLICRVEPPVLRVTGEIWYSDAAGSVVEGGAFVRHQRQIKALRQYAVELTTRIDEGDLDCALRQLEGWSAAGAMSQRPSNFAGQRERMRFIAAITLSGLRLERAGLGLSPNIRGWIARISLAAAEDFRRRGTVDNLYVWSGVTAGLAWKVTGEPRLRALANEALRSSAQSIRRDGLLRSELRRGSRGLLYHGYYLSGLLMLARMVRPEPIQSVAISRLQRTVQLGSCAPERFPSELPQVAISKNDLAAIAVLADSQSGEFCGLKESDFYDPLRGGDIRNLRVILGTPH